MTERCTISFEDLRRLVQDRPPTMDGALLEQIVAYLDSGVVLAVSPGVLFDFLRPRDFLRPVQPLPLGRSCVRTDGTWTWIGALSYFVRNYDVALPPGFLEQMQQNGWRVDQKRVRLDDVIPRDEPPPNVTADARPESEVLLRAPRALRITIRWNPAISILDQLALLRQHWPFLQQYTSRALLARAGHASEWAVGELGPGEVGGLAEAAERGGFTLNVEPLYDTD